METAYDGRQVVGMDLHRRRSVLVRMTEDGRRLGVARITNSPDELRREIAKAGKSPRVVLEGTYGWYWAADTLAAAGAEVHLAHPLGVKAFTYRRVKNDPLTEHSDVSAGHRLGGSLPLRPLTCAGPYLRGHKGVRVGLRDYRKRKYGPIPPTSLLLAAACHPGQERPRRRPNGP
jgi:hypothetical protein